MARQKLKPSNKDNSNSQPTQFSIANLLPQQVFKKVQKCVMLSVKTAENITYFLKPAQAGEK